MEICKQLKNIRKYKQVTQKELADVLGVTAQAVSRWERGEAVPDMTYIFPLCTFFGITPNELFALSENEEYVIDEIIKSSFENGNPAHAVVELHSALSRYPNNFSLMISLMKALSEESERCSFVKDNIGEIEMLSNTVQALCDDQNRCCEARLILFNYYIKTSRKGKAASILEDMPDIEYAREFNEYLLYDGDAKSELLKSLILNEADRLISDIWKYSTLKFINNEEICKSIENTINEVLKN